GSRPAMGTPRSFDDYSPVMDSADVAEMLGLPSIKTVQTLAREGRIPARRLPAVADTGSFGTRSSSGCGRMRRG
ncbi:MAG: helix-turn-helix domain-containing protein, partial [Acidimicrobiia bacterium]